MNGEGQEPQIAQAEIYEAPEVPVSKPVVDIAGKIAETFESLGARETFGKIAEGTIDDTKQPQIEPPQDGPEASQRESLDEKFPKQVRKLEHGTVAFRDIRPEHLREGGEIPMVLMTGWAMNQDVIGNTTNGLVKAGQRTIPLDIIGGTRRRLENPSPMAQMNREAETVREWIESSGEEEVTLVFQSLSAMLPLLMIEQNPEIAKKLHSVILVSPMSLDGKKSEKWIKKETEEESAASPTVIERTKQLGKSALGAVGRRLPGSSVVGLLQRKVSEDGRNNARPQTEEDVQIAPRIADSFKNFATHHFVRGAQEGFAMSQADLYDNLRLLKEKGVKVAVIQGALDKLNSSQGVWNNIGRQALDNSLVKAEYKNKDGTQKLPDELKILEGDGPDVVQQKQRRIAEMMLEIQRTANKVPLDAMTFKEGGHELFGKEALAATLLHEQDTLDYPERFGREALAEKIRLEAEAKKAKMEEITPVQQTINGETSQPENTQQ